MEKLPQAWMRGSTIAAIFLCGVNWDAVSGFLSAVMKSLHAVDRANFSTRMPVAIDLAPHATLYMTVVPQMVKMLGIVNNLIII